MRSSLVLLFVAVGPGCYLAVRGGPAFQSGNGVRSATGVEWQVTTGVEITIPTTKGRDVLDPMSGRVHIGLGGGGGESTTTTTRLSGGAGTVEARYSMIRQEWNPGNGAWIDAMGAIGGGGGTTEISQNGLSSSSSGGLFTTAFGLEAGIHGGGASSTSIGLVIGAGLADTRYSSSFGAASSISPFVEAKLEGAALAEIAVAVLLSGH